MFVVWYEVEKKDIELSVYYDSVQFSSVQFSRSVVFNSLWPHESQHTRPPCPSPTPGVHSDSRSSSQWCHPAISSSVVPFSSCPQSLPASESFPVSQPFTWGGQSTGVSASASVLPMNTQDWSPLGWTGCNSLQSKGLSRVFSNTTVQKHQFFGAQPSSQSNSHIHTWPQEKPQPWLGSPLEKGMASHFSILALRTPWTVGKGKMIGYQKRNSSHEVAKVLEFQL